MKLGYILMLDKSGSMTGAIDQVKLNAQVFVGCSRENDQFGVCGFSDNAIWVYPEGQAPNIVTVSPSAIEITAANKNIQGITLGNLTNIGDAIRIGNIMIGKATTDLKAFVMLSDGDHNTGTHPRDVLGNQPPLFVAGLGYYLDERYFTELIKKNKDSRYYPIPTSFEMMQIFNDIIGESNKSPVLMNSLNEMPSGVGYNVNSFDVSRESNELSVNVVWDNQRYKYVTGYLQKNTFRPLLIDPDNRQTQYQPYFVGDGFCVYRLKNLKPGKWKLWTEYSIDNRAYCTFGCVNYASDLKPMINAPPTVTVGENIKLSVQMYDGKAKLTNAFVRAHIEKPTISLNSALKKYEQELRKITGIGLEDVSSSDIITKGRNIIMIFFISIFFITHALPVIFL